MERSWHSISFLDIWLLREVKMLPAVIDIYYLQHYSFSILIFFILSFYLHFFEFYFIFWYDYFWFRSDPFYGRRWGLVLCSFERVIKLSWGMLLVNEDKRDSLVKLWHLFNFTDMASRVKMVFGVKISPCLFWIYRVFLLFIFPPTWFFNPIHQTHTRLTVL